MNQLSQQIASRLSAFKRADHKRQDDAADKVGRLIDQWYLQVVRASDNRIILPELIKRIHRKFHIELVQVYEHELEQLARSGHDDAVEAILGAMNEEEMRSLLESQEPITEAANRPELPYRQPRWVLPYLDAAAIAALTKNEIKRILKQILFPPMSRRTVQQLLFQQQAMNRIAPITRLITPQQLISIISQAQSKGWTRVEIARKALEPVFQTTKSDARRVARTVGALVANESNMLAFQGLGSRLIGYQVHCVTDKASRPWHQARKGVVYYINPVGDQKGLRQKPSPPYEPEDPNERPPDAPFCAFNCRCFLSPVTNLTLALSRERAARQIVSAQ